jgi:hypothetical protein
MLGSGSSLDNTMLSRAFERIDKSFRQRAAAEVDLHHMLDSSEDEVSLVSTTCWTHSLLLFN